MGSTRTDKPFPYQQLRLAYQYVKVFPVGGSKDINFRKDATVPPATWNAIAPVMQTIVYEMSSVTAYRPLAFSSVMQETNRWLATT
uniref:Uncharacterized protein n=1 Tax=Anopheles quadriannulatus TaxID=34691 RepID=A0A182XGC9_ANOQN